jgi:cell division protein FtsB
MSTSRELRRRGRHVVPPILLAAFLAYAGYHAVEGERGLKSWWSLNRQVDTAKTEIVALKAERAYWQQRVDLLRGKRPDRDMLDERTRFMLNRGRSDELIILYHRPLGAKR